MITLQSEMSAAPKIRSFTDLIAWKESHALVLMIYTITRSFPKNEIFGLTSQIRRASVSITSNLAEGFSRQSYADKIHFYSMALGSDTEVQNQLLIARDINYLPAVDFDRMAAKSVQVNKLINGLIKSSRKFLDS